ncbi:MAG: hypothetical protein ABSD74_06655 [Rhizomicrobium sp.]|jgi:hypothetical protein
MKWHSAGLLMLAGALVAVPALAATPVISGKYAYTSDTFCQPTLTIEYAVDHWGLTLVNGINQTAPEDTAQESGQATFDSAKATVSYKSDKDHGSEVLLQTSGGLQGSTIASKKQKGSAGYANTATTVTLNGATFNAYYGAAGKKGTPAYFALIGLDTSGCSEEWEFTLK